MATFSEKVKLTERTVAAAEPAPGARAKFYLDTPLVGFGLAVSGKGSKSYRPDAACHRVPLPDHPHR